MSAAASEVSARTVYASLMAARKGDPVEEILARIIASWTLGVGAMPCWLGVGEARFRRMLGEHFPGLQGGAFAAYGRAVDERRSDEMQDLLRLLLQNRTHGNDDEALMAEIVVAACMGADHLWQDLGLWQRADLTRLMLENFRPLARRNDRDMKWKRFLYKRLCETEGIYTCRAPSCEACRDYRACFGPEE